MVKKNVFFVSCSEYNFNKIQKAKKKSDIINPYLITIKLSDKNKLPSDEIVSYHIIKKINNFKKCKFSQFIYYYCGDTIKNDLINELKEIFDNTEYETKFHFLIDLSIKIDKIEQSILDNFDSIQYIENL